MTAHFKLPEQNAIAAAAARLLEAGAGQEVVLGVLRKGGLSMIDSIKLLGELTGMPLMQAKNVVQASRAWSHGFARDRALQILVDDALEALREDNRTGP